MGNAEAERVVLERFYEKSRMTGEVRAGYGLRKKAIEQAAAEHPGLDLDAGLAGLVEKGALKANAKGDWFFLTAQGVGELAASSS